MDNRRVYLIESNTLYRPAPQIEDNGCVFGLYSTCVPIWIIQKKEKRKDEYYAQLSASWSNVSREKCPVRMGSKGQVVEAFSQQI